MLERLAQRIDHYRYTDKGVIIEGSLSQSEFRRLSEVTTEGSDNLEYKLEFGIDPQSTRYAKGWVKTRLVLQCQRCLENYILDIESKIVIAFVHSDYEIERAEKTGYDAYLLNDKQWGDPRLILEDEILLSIPLIPSHQEDDEACQVKLEYSVPAASEVGNKMSGQEDSNPFAVLKNLKK